MRCLCLGEAKRAADRIVARRVGEGNLRQRAARSRGYLPLPVGRKLISTVSKPKVVANGLIGLVIEARGEGHRHFGSSVCAPIIARKCGPANQAMNLGIYWHAHYDLTPILGKESQCWPLSPALAELGWTRTIAIMPASSWLRMWQ
jgi:hypothetical protein